MSELTQCPINDLHAYLDDTLDASLHTQLLIHLDHCEACRQRIERQAGAADVWRTAKKALSTCKLDANGCIVAEYSLAESLVSSHIAAPFSLLPLLSPTDDPQSAGRIGPFEITGIIGSGGMGLVLKAREPALDRYVAIKMLAPHLARSQSARKRFAREARAAAAVIHDNVIAIYQVAEWNELPYLVMPYLPDPSLQQRIDDQGRLDIESTLSIGMQVARGLAAAHAQGLVHRDIKPANVLLAKGTERAIITDFGLARAADDASLTHIGLLAGTPHYMSPEQARGEVVDQKSDLFSLGSLLFAMTTGRPPIADEHGSETIQQIARGRIPSLGSQAIDAPAWLTKLVDWLHQPQPVDRPESAAQAAQWLEQCLAHHRQPDLQPLPVCLLPNRITPPSRRITVFAGAMCTIAAIAYPAWLVLNRTAVEESFTESILKAPVTEPGKVTNNSPIELLPVGPRTPQPNWFGDQTKFDELTEQSKVLQANLDQTWEVMPQLIEPPHLPTPPK